MSLVECCRLCLKNLADVLLDEDGHFTIADDRNLQRMIFECFQILVSDGEIISKVCNRCNDQIRAVDKIRKRVRRVDFEIKQYYASLIVKQEDDLVEEVPKQSRSHANEDTELHQMDNQQLDPEPSVSASLEDDDTISNYNFINKYEFIEVEPNFDYDRASMERNSSESQSESEHSYKAPIKQRKKTTPKKVGNKVDSKCYICATEFGTAEALDNHISTHVGSTGQVCNLCQLPVSTVRYLNMHLRRVHFRKGKRIPCEECKKNNIVREFSSNYKLQAHIKTVHERIVEILEKNFICTYCGKSFSRGTHLRLHENIHTKAILYKCKQCPFSATSRSGLYRHERIHTAEKPFKCNECDASFNQSNALHSHKIAKHSDERPFSCEICGDEKRFKTKYTLQTHMRAHQKAGINQIGRPQLTDMGTEITVCERELKCNFCPAVYSWEKFLCRHLVEKHPEENVPMLSCELCQEANKNVFFLTQSEKDRHIDKHDKLSKMPIKERVCPECGEVFQTSDTYQRHRQTHLKNDCKDCGKSFATRKTLRLHLVTVHLKSRPYKCDKCDSSFGQLTSLTAHMKVHQRPHKS
ncbi:zinc finger protein 813-like [Ochlerotatus camptorhynchus]|uniref:zinc finger protein 813-like n=1 Tax=Ochlerotatus camptorhynchus TaxID=644619 RepID=UPI0031DD548C